MSSVYLKLFVTVSFWGASFIATKVAVRTLHPVEVVWARTLLGLAVMWWMLKLRGVELRWRGVPVPALVLLGFLSVFVQQVVQAYAMKFSMASTATWIIGMSSVFIALLGYLFLGERLRAIQALGIGLSFFGVALVMGRGYPGSLLGFGFSRGDLVMLLTSLNWAVFSVLSRSFLSSRGLDGLLAIFYVMAFGFLFESAALPLFARWDLLARLSEPRVASSILFLGVCCTGLAYAFWYDGLGALSAYRVGVFMYLQPLVGTVLSYRLLGERMSPWSLLGGAMILLGVYMVNRKP